MNIYQVDNLVIDEPIFFQCMALVQDIPNHSKPSYLQVAADHYNRLTGANVDLRRISSHATVQHPRLERRLESAMLETGDLERARLLRPSRQRWPVLGEDVVLCEAEKWGVAKLDGMGEDELWNAVLYKRLLAVAARLFCPNGKPDGEALWTVVAYAFDIKRDYAVAAFAGLTDPVALWNKLRSALRDRTLDEFFAKLVHAISNHLRRDGSVKEYDELEAQADAEANDNGVSDEDTGDEDSNGEDDEADDEESDQEPGSSDEGVGLESKFESRVVETLGLSVHAPASEIELSQWRAQSVLET